MENNPPNPTASVVTELKPCPFDCGGKGEGAEGALVVIQSPKGWFKVLCTFCMAEGPDARTIEQARNRWNDRKSADQPPPHTGLTDVERRKKLVYLLSTRLGKRTSEIGPLADEIAALLVSNSGVERLREALSFAYENGFRWPERFKINRAALDTPTIVEGEG